MATFFTSDLHLGHIHNSITTDAYGYIKEHLPCALNAGVDINGCLSAVRYIMKRYMSFILL